MSATAIPLDKALTAYVNMRDEITRRDADHKIWKADQKQSMDKIEQYLNQMCLDLGTDSLKAGGNTAFKATKDSVAVADKSTFLNTIATMLVEDLELAGAIAASDVTAAIREAAASPAFDLLTLSANKTNCKEFMADNNGLMPTGVKYHSEKVIQIRKGNK